MKIYAKLNWYYSYLRGKWTRYSNFENERNGSLTTTIRQAELSRSPLSLYSFFSDWMVQAEKEKREKRRR